MAEAAIDAYNDEDYGKVIEMPNGVSLLAIQICEQLHLDPWLNDSWEDDYEELDDEGAL